MVGPPSDAFASGAFAHPSISGVGWPSGRGLARLAAKGRTAMMSQEQNDLITRTGPKDACGKLMRMYWQPAALVDELQGPRPVKTVKMLGENLGLFRDEQGRT